MAVNEKRSQWRCWSALVLLLATVAACPGQSTAAQETLFVSSVLTVPGLFTSGIEGPACDAQGTLYAVNFARQGTIGKVTPSGQCSLFVELPAGSVGNGIRFDSRGAMLVADYVGHNLLQVDMATRQVSVRAHGPQMSQPNDLAIGADDRVYASDPNWGNSTGRLWRIDPDGSVVLLESGMGTANGIEVGPGDRALYVNESVQRKVWVYDLSPAGEISNKRLLIEFPDFGMDGMRCDADGNLYIARYGKGTVAKVSPRGELLLEVSLAGKDPSNVAFGGPDGRTCYVTLADLRQIETFRTDRPGWSWQLEQQRQTSVAPGSWGKVKQEQR
jgi:gluconolactonase